MINESFQRRQQIRPGLKPFRGSLKITLGHLVLAEVLTRPSR